MAAVAKKPARDDTKQYMYAWVGKDKTGKVIKGEVPLAEMFGCARASRSPASRR